MPAWSELGEALSLPEPFVAYLQDITAAFTEEVWWYRLARDCWCVAGGDAQGAALAGKAFTFGAYAANIIDDLSDRTRAWDSTALNGAVAISHTVPLILSQLGDVLDRNPTTAIQSYYQTVLQMSGGQHIGFVDDGVTLERAESILSSHASWFIWGCDLYTAYYGDSRMDLASFGRALGLAHQLRNDWEGLLDPSLTDIRTHKPSVALAYAHHIAGTEDPPDRERFLAAWQNAPENNAAARTVQQTVLAWGGVEYLEQLQRQVLAEAEAALHTVHEMTLQTHLDLLRISRD